MRIACFALAALFVTPAIPQSVTVLMQRAIYLEETAGDLDGAIQIYRQILSAGADARAYEAEAQYHLGASLLKKGNKAQAARAFQELMRKFPEDTRLVQQASVHYVDPSVGYSFTVPAGWGLHPRAPYNGGPGTCVDLQDPENQGTATICAKPHKSAVPIDDQLLRGETELVQGRKISFSDYTLRAGSPNPGWIGGQRTLTILADFNLGSNRSTEWATWVQTENSRSSLIVVTRAAVFDAFQARFLPILNSYRLP
jgi:hypothetical protein